MLITIILGTGSYNNHCKTMMVKYNNNNDIYITMNTDHHRNGGTCVAHFRRLICVCRQVTIILIRVLVIIIMMNRVVIIIIIMTSIVFICVCRQVSIIVIIIIARVIIFIIIVTRVIVFKIKGNGPRPPSVSVLIHWTCSWIQS